MPDCFAFCCHLSCIEDEGLFRLALYVVCSIGSPCSDLRSSRFDRQMAELQVRGAIEPLYRSGGGAEERGGSERRCGKSAVGRGPCSCAGLCNKAIEMRNHVWGKILATGPTYQCELWDNETCSLVTVELS